MRLARALPRSVVATGLAVVLALASGQARADFDAAFLVPVEAYRAQSVVPPLVLNGSDTGRRVVGVPVPGAETLYGVSVGLTLITYDHKSVEKRRPYGFAFNLLRASFAWSGDSGDAHTQSGGGPVTVARDGVKLLELAAPLFEYGAFLSYDRIKVGVALDWGWAYLWADGAVLDASRVASTGSVNAGSPFVHVPLSACLLGNPFAKAGTFRPGEDVCLTLTPNVYEFGFLEGWSAGVRVDL